VSDLPPINEFILARVSEDERIAGRESDPATARGVVRTEVGPFDPARVMDQCEAFRSIVATHSPGERGWFCNGCQTYDEVGDPNYWCATLPHLAALWADHGDFNPKWMGWVQ
jgi:hypothetical protein